jgi:hypothetical protein
MKTIIAETPTDYDRARIIERADGYYWQDDKSGAQFGPFETLVAAVEDMQFNSDSEYEPGESLGEAQDEIGIADWVDPDTGELAEDGTPHLTDL